MSVWRLIVKEIGHRKLNFALGTLCVLVASGVLVGALTLLSAHDLQTVEILTAAAADEKERLDENKDDYRKLAKDLSFNLLMLHKDQDRAAFFAANDATIHMPESHASKLANSTVVSINHLLPMLWHKVHWDEGNRDVILIGVKRELPLALRKANPDPRELMVQPVQPETVELGDALRGPGVRVDEPITFLGEKFTVAKINKPVGTMEDIFVWMHLERAQKLLYDNHLIPERHLINVMKAINCQCYGKDPEQVAADVRRVLPELQVIPQTRRREVRAKMRGTAATLEKKTLAASRRDRQNLRRAREAYAAILVPVIVVACAVFVAALSVTNVRDRRIEIGILRALGMSSGKVLLIFLGKALLTGILGAALGYVAGFVVGAAWGEGTLAAAGALFDPVVLLLVLVVAPLLAALASWIPALVAAQQDPALALREE